MTKIIPTIQIRIMDQIQITDPGLQFRIHFLVELSYNGSDACRSDFGPLTFIRIRHVCMQGRIQDFSEGGGAEFVASLKKIWVFGELSCPGPPLKKR